MPRSEEDMILSNFQCLTSLNFEGPKHSTEIDVYISHMPLLQKLKICTMSFNLLEIGINVPFLRKIQSDDASLIELVFRDYTPLKTLALEDSERILKFDPFQKVRWQDVECLKIHVSPICAHALQNPESIKILELLTCPLSSNMPWEKFVALQQLEICLTKEVMQSIMCSSNIFKSVTILNCAWARKIIFDCKLLVQFPNVVFLRMTGRMYCNFKYFFELKHVREQWTNDMNFTQEDATKLEEWEKTSAK